MKASHVSTLLLTFSPLASAFPFWPRWLPDIDAVVVRRADSSSSSSTSATETASSAAATTTADAADATDLNTAGQTKTSSSSGTASGTGTDASGTGTGTASGTGTSDSTKKTTKTSSVSVSSGAAAGSAVMLSPVTTLTSALYKIGDYVTFSWNYTDLEIKPTAVDVVISASTSSLGASTWTLTSNMSFATDGAFTWDTESYQSKAQANQKPLVVEMYTLYIYDAESSVTATAGPGSLTANAALTFGLYTGQPYTPLSSGWVCGTCSAALSDNERRAIGFAITMAGISVATFTWFVTGLW